MPATTPGSAFACIVALCLAVLLLVVPWSNDPDAGSRTYWDRHEGPREDGHRVSNDVWHEDELAPGLAAVALVVAILLLLPCALVAVSGGAMARDGTWKRWALLAGLLLIASAIAWMQGPWRTFGAGPALAMGAGALALWAGASRGTASVAAAPLEG